MVFWSGGCTSEGRGERSPGGCKFPWLIFLATKSNKTDARGVEKAYSPSPPGHFRPASNEKTSPSQPYFLKNFKGHCHCSCVLLSVYRRSAAVTSIRPFWTDLRLSLMFFTLKVLAGIFCIATQPMAGRVCVRGMVRWGAGRARGGEWIEGWLIDYNSD